MRAQPLDARSPAVVAAVIYACAYLYALGDLDLLSDSAWTFRFGDASLSRWFAMRSPFHFEAIALADLGRISILISPLNLVVAVTLAILLALNIHGAIELHRQPASCRTASGSSLMGAAPALLAGGACCAPSLILLLGVPGLGVFAGFFGWLVPLSFAALVGSRWWQHRLGAPNWRIARF